MKKLIFFLAFVAVMANTYAQSQIKGYGSKPKAGDVIHGIVMDQEGPVKAVDIFEVNEKHEVVAYVYSDKNGQFSFNLVDPADSIFVGDYRYNTAKSSISKSRYEVTLEKCTDVAINTEMNYLFRRTYRSLMDESQKYPFLYMDGHVIYRDKNSWEGIDPYKDNFSKQEMSRLFGVEAGQIEQIKVYEKGNQAAMEYWGSVAERGVIEIQTKEKKNKNL